MGEIDLRGRVGEGINQVSHNMSLAIQSHAMVNAAVRGISSCFWSLWGARRPQMCKSGYHGMVEIDLS